MRCRSSISRQRIPGLALLEIMLVLTLLMAMTAGVASAQPPPKDPNADLPADRPVATAPGRVPERDREGTLGKGWQTSTDRAVTTSGDADGFHVFTARAAEGYAWREVTTLTEPGFDTDRWVGNLCVTGSARRAVVVYAPRAFLNRGPLFERGGLVAVLDLDTGSVTKLPVTASLAYFSPSCGAGEQALLTQSGEDLGRTRLVRVQADAPSGAMIAGKVEVSGQLTSAVPTSQGIVAADDGALVGVADDGGRRVLTRTQGTPFKLSADAQGGVVFLERAGASAVAARRTVVPAPNKRAGQAQTLASGPLTDVDVNAGRGGRVFVTGEGTRQTGVLPPSVSVVGVPTGARLSSDGALAITAVDPTLPPDVAPLTNQAAVPLRVTATAVATGKPVVLSATPAATAADLVLQRAALPGTPAGGPAQPASRDGAEPGRALSPSLATQTVAAGSPTSPADPNDRTCSVTRNDPANQAMQPKPRQVEWAVDQAVTGSLTVQRPANWKNLGMPAYTPQGLFPSIPLTGGGRVPAQVLLGVAAQESNMWEAARFAVPGVTANPLIGNYYGTQIYDNNAANDWDIDFSRADCGYGVLQVTDGMRLAGKTKPGEVAMPYQTQRAVALDFAANIAAGLRILQDKWNQLKAAGILVNNADPARIENWFMAVWAYNTGFYPQSTASQHGGAWGVGWLNNPANPNYPANRTPFLDGNAYSDASHPQDWPYPEKVMGFAAWPPQLLEAPNQYVAGYRAAFWNGKDVTEAANRRSAVKPPVNQFCDASDQCTPGTLNTPNGPDVVGEPAGPCAHKDSTGRYDLLCWYHQSATWKPDCAITCGYELLRFDPGFAYQDDALSYPPLCDLTGLPAGAQIVDDVPDGAPVVRPNCGRPWTNAGTFTLNFKADPNGTYPGKIDTHQIGGGFGGHFWFTHTRTATDTSGRLTVEGAWKLAASYTGLMRVLVALPDHGAETRASTYTVVTANGQQVRRVPQPGNGNRWQTLGTFKFANVPEVRLSSATSNGNGSQDVAFDAVAFAPTTGTYQEQSVEAVSLFDEDQNIDTAAPESWLAGPLAGRQALFNWAMQRSSDILSLPPCPGAGQPGQCRKPAVTSAMQRWRNIVQAAGVDPVAHPAGNSIGDWIGFALPYTDRPTSASRPASADDDNRYKIRFKTTVSFVVDNNAVVPASAWTSYEDRTGNTHLPDFVREFFNAISADYGPQVYPVPDLTYRSADLNVHDGLTRTANPAIDNILPGRAYATAGLAPAVVTVNSQSCIRVRGVAGGSIGYRPMLAQPGPAAAMEAMGRRLAGDATVASTIVQLFQDVRGLFFDDGFAIGFNASLFNAAPPIWNELTFAACADGTVKPIPGFPILRTSFMPDSYLYRNGTAITLTGAASTSAGPLRRGDFLSFSSSPAPNRNSPYTNCNTASGSTGNPWGIQVVDAVDANPPAHLCDDAATPGDIQFSSP
jgi:hypothetical protein